MDSTIKLLIKRLDELEKKHLNLEKKYEKLSTNYNHNTHRVWMLTENGQSSRSDCPSFGEPEKSLHKYLDA